MATNSSGAKEVAITTNNNGVDQAPVAATVLKEGAKGFEFELPLGLPIGLGITHYVERIGKGRTPIEVVELGYNAEGQTPIYQYAAFYI
jgi:hypothetical protein